MKIKKRHVVLAAMILALGAAVYLNWQYADAGSLIAPTAKELGEVTYVNAEAEATSDEAEAVSKEQSDSASYFAQAKIERQQSQDNAVDLAKEVLTLSDSSDDAKSEAAEQLGDLEERFLAQSNIEGVLKAKGFSECLCFISDDGCSVAVKASELKDNSPLIIKDAVLSQYEMDFNDITIVEV
ncbi:MAG: SpoIIIAH-like family protein [Ruminococcus sp.]|nr:SpoIIIAH-like family protein [Ruminococcus sp.]